MGIIISQYVRIPLIMRFFGTLFGHMACMMPTLSLQEEPMEPNEMSFKDCDKTCPRDCEIMNRILLREAAVEHLYLQLLKECDYPDVREFVKKMVEERKEHVERLEKSLNKMYSSFDPAGC